MNVENATTNRRANHQIKVTLEAQAGLFASNSITMSVHCFPLETGLSCRLFLYQVFETRETTGPGSQNIAGEAGGTAGMLQLVISTAADKRAAWQQNAKGVKL